MIFSALSNRRRAPGTGELVALGDEWRTKAETAYRHAAAACYHEQRNEDPLAGQQWQEIFGSASPLLVS